MQNVCKSPVRPGQSLLPLFRSYFSETDKDHIGTELEFPILHVTDARDCLGIIPLLIEKIQDLGFQPDAQEKEKQIRFMNIYGDIISFECTYSTLEFSMAKEFTLHKIENRFRSYFEKIQDWLLDHDFFLGCSGLNHSKHYKKYAFLDTPHYQAIHSYLNRFTPKEFTRCRHAPVLMIGNQTHLDCAFPDLFRIQHVFQKLGWVESLLFANSPTKDKNSYDLLFRDKLLNHSAFGLNSNNTRHDLRVARDNYAFFQEFQHKSIFTKNLGGKVYYFAPIRISNLLIKHHWVNGYIPGQDDPIKIKLDRSDIPDVLAFNPVRITKYGTLELRGVCQQPYEALFAPTAFYLGIKHNLGQVEEILRKYPFHQNRNLRQKSNQTGLNPFHQEICKKVVAASRRGLVHRGQNEESYLDVIDNRLECLSNPAQQQLQFISDHQSIFTFLKSKSLPK